MTENTRNTNLFYSISYQTNYYKLNSPFNLLMAADNSNIFDFV